MNFGCARNCNVGLAWLGGLYAVEEMNGFYSYIQSHHKKVKQMISEELELNETNPAKHMVTLTLTLVSEYTLVHFDSPRQKINGRDTKVKS